MKKLGVKTVVFILIVCITIPFINVNAANEAVNINMSYSGYAGVNEEIKIKITVSKLSEALAGLEFSLSYNPEFVTPVVTKNTESGLEMNSFIEAIPSGWEQMCNHSEDENKYYFRFAMPESGDSYLNSEGGIVLEVPFKIKASGVFGFYIENSDIIAISAENNLSLLSGKGSEMSVTASSETEKFSVELESKNASENGLYFLDIQVRNLGDNEGMIGFQFDLHYDESVFKPFITQNDNGQMDPFMVSMPQNGWEQMCTLYEEEKKYTLRFAALHAESIEESETLDLNQTLKLSVPFIVVGTIGDKAEFEVIDVSVHGINNATKLIDGRGDSISVSVENAVSVLPDSGYTVENGCLIHAPVETDVSDFLKTVSSSFYVMSNGVKKTEGNVCTGDILTDGKKIALTIIVKGDVNGNGKIDVRDFAFIKQTYFKLYSPTKAQLYAMCITGKDAPTAKDFAMVKLHYFKLHNING